MVCGDSHTATHGALGALAFGIGSSEVAHVLATQTLWQRARSTMRITRRRHGSVRASTAKDVILAIIARIGAAGGTGHVDRICRQRDPRPVDRGPADPVQHVDRGRRAAPAWSRRTKPPSPISSAVRIAPQGAMWDKAVAFWRTLPSDPTMRAFDREVSARRRRRSRRWSPGAPARRTRCPSPARVPDPDSVPDRRARATAMLRALDYMGLTPGRAAGRHRRSTACSSAPAPTAASRICAPPPRSRAAAAPWCTAMVVPGSGLVQRAGRSRGAGRDLQAAGFEWRRAGCSMCVGMNGDTVAPGQRCASTSNRNFVGRQGQGARTHLVSPAMAAAAAVTGHFTDVRRLMGGLTRWRRFARSTPSPRRSAWRTSTPTRSSRRASCGARAPTATAAPVPRSALRR